MRASDTRRVAELAMRQNGNVTHAQLRTLGFSPGEIARRCVAGWLIRRHTGVYAVGHVPATRASAWHAAVLALGDVPHRALARAFEQAQVLLHLPPAPLAAEVISRPRQRGNAKLRRVLLGAVDPADVRSVLELRFLQMCASHGIPRPLVNVGVGDWTPDFQWPEQGLVVETDGAAFHRTAAPRRRDAVKDEVLRGLGLTVIRLTWAEVTERPAQAARRILDHHGCRLDAA